MSGWNWRLFKDRVKDTNGTELDRIRFQEIWYDDEGKPNGIGDCEISLEQFAECKDQIGKFDFTEIEYDNICEEAAKDNIEFTLTKLLEALDKPVLSKSDFGPDVAIPHRPKRHSLNDLVSNITPENKRSDVWDKPESED